MVPGVKRHRRCSEARRCPRGRGVRLQSAVQDADEPVTQLAEGGVVSSSTGADGGVVAAGTG